MLYGSIIWQSDNRLQWEENRIIVALNRKSHLKIQLLSCLARVLYFNEKQALGCQSASLDTISILCDQMRTLNLILMFWELIFNIHGGLDLWKCPLSCSEGKVTIFLPLFFHTLTHRCLDPDTFLNLELTCLNCISGFQLLPGCSLKSLTFSTKSFIISSHLIFKFNLLSKYSGCTEIFKHW